MLLLEILTPISLLLVHLADRSVHEVLSLLLLPLSQPRRSQGRHFLSRSHQNFQCALPYPAVKVSNGKVDLNPAPFNSPLPYVK